MLRFPFLLKALEVVVGLNFNPQTPNTFNLEKAQQHDKEMSAETDLILIATNLVLAVAAVIAVLYAYKTVKEDKKSREAQFLYDLLNQYSTEKMRKYISTLREFKRKHPDVAKAYKEQYKDGNPLDLARRGVSQYYQRIATLRNAGYVSELFVKTLFTDNDADFLWEEIIPIGKAHAETIGTPFNEQVFDCLFKIIEFKKSKN